MLFIKFLNYSFVLLQNLKIIHAAKFQTFKFCEHLPSICKFATSNSLTVCPK